MAINDKLMEELKDLVAKALSDSDLAGFEQKLEEVTEDTKQAISDLIKKASELEAQLIDKTAQVEALESEKGNLVVALESSTSELSALKAEKDALLVQVASMNDSLEAIKLNSVEKSRMEELATLAVVRKEGEALKAQASKVRVMSDDEFASYRDELVAMKAEFSGVGGVPAAPVQVAAPDVTPPADLDSARSEAAALPNVASVAMAGMDSKARIEELTKEFSALLASTRGSEATSTKR